MFKIENKTFSFLLILISNFDKRKLNKFEDNIEGGNATDSMSICT